MAIVFSGDTGIQQDSFANFANMISGELHRIKSGFLASIDWNAETAMSKMWPNPPAENVFVDDGFTNVPGTAFPSSKFSGIDDIKTRRITTQEPNATVYIKKKMFWSLRNEYDPRFMDYAEKLLVRASKILFEMKCSQIAAYEALTKASRLASEDSELDAELLNLLADLLEEGLSKAIAAAQASMNAAQNSTTNSNVLQMMYDSLTKINNDASKLVPTIAGLRKLSGKVLKTKQATNTNWVVDVEANTEDVLSLGRGSGVIELTLISNISTQLGIGTRDKGSVQFSVQDPYNLMKISSYEIESAVVSAFYEMDNIEILKDSNVSKDQIAQMFNASPMFFLEEARRKEERLNKIRRDKVSSTFGLASSSGPVGTAGAPEIIFEVNPTTMSSNKISVSISSIPESFESSVSFSLGLLSLPVEHQLGIEENQLVTEIFGLLQQYVDSIAVLDKNARELNSNENVEYARRKMRQMYLGKNLIQPMDGVHVYLRSNTFRDGQVVGPLSALLNDSHLIQSFSNAVNITDPMLEEEMRLFGIDNLNIPVGLYRSIRTGSLMRNAGTHVFGGLVSTVSERYSPDSGYVLDVSGESNLKWLDMSRVNTKPSLDQRQGVLEDPITPLKFDIDPATGLIKSEPEWLQHNKDIQDKLNNTGGTVAGKVTEETFVQDFLSSGAKQTVPIPVGQHAPGMVYRWKEGVIAATLNVNQRTALDGSGTASDRLRGEYGVNVVENPFSSADAADIVSTLVTGYPHNYESFVLNAQSIGTFTFGHNNSSESYFHHFFDAVRKQNRALGDFMPFKVISISQKQMAERMKLKTDIQNQSQKLNEMRKQLAELQDRLNSIETMPDVLQAAANKNASADNANKQLNDQRSALVVRYQTSITNLRDEILKETAKFNSTVSAGSNAGLRIYGNDIAYEIEQSTGGSKEEEIAESDKKKKIKNKVLQLRSQTACKFNSDTNLFMVSDEYDKDTDIQAFVLASVSSGSNLFESSYATPLDTCTNVAQTLDFEFFCDTQGHIQFRPPQYNKVPLSLLLKLFLLERNENKKIYPVFLQQLFKTRQKTFVDEIQTKNLQMQELLILLGTSKDKLPPESAVSIINEQDSANFLPFIDANLPSIDVMAQAKLLLEVRNKLASDIGGSKNSGSQEEIDAAKKELSQYNAVTGIKNPNITTNRLNLVNRLARLTSDKQRLITLSSRLGGQVERFDKSQQESFTGGGTRRLTELEMANLLAPFENLVENDMFDDLGPGSGARFIIDDDQLLSYEFTESDNEVYCRYDITGNQNLINSTDGNVAGVPIIWAGATDFDLWRQYGWRSMGAINKPFFVDAEHQCSPYALMLLSRMRRDIVRGSVTVAGNEYYQLGDVVYVNSRDMLYYVTGIRHSFSYDGSGSFTTQLDLRFGHPLGDYIPTPLDVIGKQLSKNQIHFNRTITSRQTSSKKLGVNLGIVRFPFNFESTDPKDINNEMLSGSFGVNNLKSLKNALLKAQSKITSGGTSKVEIRSFVVDDADKDKVKARADAVAGWLKSPISEMDSNGNGVCLNKDDFPALPNESIVIASTVNIKLPSQEDVLNNKFPKEEVFSATTDGDVTNIIDIELIFE